MSMLTSMPPGIQGTDVFPLLADPHSYAACSWLLTDDDARRTYWVDLFRRHWSSLLAEAREEALARGVLPASIDNQIQSVRSGFEDYLDQVQVDPASQDCPDTLQICVMREVFLRQAGIADPYRLAKQRQNETCLKLLPRLLAQLDALQESCQAQGYPGLFVERLMQGIFAGNIFDLGATQTMALFAEGRTVDFHEVRSRLKPRPWYVDDFDRWEQRLVKGPAYQGAVVFVDNAGPDILLGMLPFVRDLLRRGTQVILTANTGPSLNDITHDELKKLFARVGAWDRIIHDALEQGTLTLVASGNGLPLIDLTQISGSLARWVRNKPIDLVVLEGMGRAVESNYHAKFRCDTLKLAMIKDQGVASWMGAGLYDLVFRFDQV